MGMGTSDVSSDRHLGAGCIPEATQGAEARWSALQGWDSLDAIWPDATVVMPCLLPIPCQLPLCVDHCCHTGARLAAGSRADHLWPSAARLLLPTAHCTSGWVPSVGTGLVIPGRIRRGLVESAHRARSLVADLVLIGGWPRRHRRGAGAGRELGTAQMGQHHRLGM